LAAAAVTVIGLGCLSAWLLTTRIDHRSSERSFIPAAGGAPTALTMDGLYDELRNGRQIYVYWLRVVDPDTRVMGVAGPPRPGTWWVSPALATAIAREPGLRSRYPNARTIDLAGIAQPDELLAYRFLGPGPDLSERFTRQRGGGWIGDGGETVELYPIAVAGLGLIGIPGVGLLTAAMGPSSGALQRRRRLLVAIGASRWTEQRLVATHVAVSSLPGALIGAAGWWAIAPRLEVVPLVGRRVVPGDLAVPVLAALVASAAVTGLATLVASVRVRRERTTRPSDAAPRRPSAARLAPLLVGLATLAAGVAIPDRGGARVFIMGIVATTLGATAALPFLIDRAGAALARGRSTVALLVGRRLGWNASSSARSLVAVGALGCLVPVVAAWVAVARDLDRADPRPSLVVELRGHLSRPDVSALSRRTRATVTVDADSETNRFTAATAADAVRTERMLRSYVVNGSQAHRQVTIPGRDTGHESPLVRWILGAATTFGLVALAALGLHLATQAAELARSRARLVALGADRGFLRRLAGAEAAGSVLLVGLGGTTVGAVNSWMFVQRDASAAVPVLVISLVAIVVLVAGAVAGLAAAATVSDRLSTGRD
jgi:hypothetical protein